MSGASRVAVGLLVVATLVTAGRIVSARSAATPATPSVSVSDTWSAPPEATAWVRELGAGCADAPSRARAVFDFVRDEVRLIPEGDGAPIDLPRTWIDRRGSAAEKMSLLESLWRAQGWPTRRVFTRIGDGLEVQVDDRWWRADLRRGHLTARPADATAVAAPEPGRSSEAEDDPGSTEGATSTTSGEGLRPAWKLLPLGMLLLSALRHVVGLSTLGTFSPLLLGLALDMESTGVGATLLLTIGLGGWITHRLLDRLHLLVLPRLSLLASVLLVLIMGWNAACQRWGHSEWGLGGLFPLVIVTGGVEKLSHGLTVDGVGPTLRTAGVTVVTALLSARLLGSRPLQDLFGERPELQLVVVAGLLLVGRYTGYRWTEWQRFGRLGRSG